MTSVILLGAPRLFSSETMVHHDRTLLLLTHLDIYMYICVFNYFFVNVLHVFPHLYSHQWSNQFDCNIQITGKPLLLITYLEFSFFDYSF